MNLRDKILVDISKKTKLQLWMKISKSLGVVNTLEKKKKKKTNNKQQPPPKKWDNKNETSFIITEKVKTVKKVTVINKVNIGSDYSL